MGRALDLVFEGYLELWTDDLFPWLIPVSFSRGDAVKVWAPKLFPCYKFYALHVWANEPGTIDVGHTMGFSHVNEMLVSAFTK